MTAEPVVLPAALVGFHMAVTLAQHNTGFCCLSRSSLLLLLTNSMASLLNAPQQQGVLLPPWTAACYLTPPALWVPQLLLCLPGQAAGASMLS